MSATTDAPPTGELPGMPTRPELRTSNGRLIENGHISVKGGLSFDLRSRSRRSSTSLASRSATTCSWSSTAASLTTATARR